VSASRARSRAGRPFDDGARVIVVETGRERPPTGRRFSIFRDRAGTYTCATGEGFFRLKITDVVVRAGADTLLARRKCPRDQGW